MNIEKRHLKMFKTIIIVVLAAVLVTAFSGFIVQRQQIMPFGDNGMDAGSSTNLMQPESAQTGPTGKLVMIVGIILLMVGFGALLLILIFPIKV